MQYPARGSQSICLHMAVASDFAQTLKQQVDIVRVVGDYVSLKKAGAQNYSGLCPFHKEKTPSFSVHATRQFYHCFGCGKSGDVFKFIQEIENVSFPEAIRAVAQKMGVAMPKATFSSEAEARDAKIRTALLEIHERASSFFQEYLWRSDGARAREYLMGRGLDEATIRKFRIGFAPDSGFILRDRLKGEFSEEVLRESGLMSWKDGVQASGFGLPGKPSYVVGRTSSTQNPENPSSVPSLSSGQALDSNGQSASGSPGVARDDTVGGNGSRFADGGRRTTDDKVLPTTDGRRPTAVSSMYSKFRNRVMFPIANESGRVIAFTGRTLSTDEKAGPKYLNSPETAIYSKSRVLFNLDVAKEAIRALNYAILVEGQMDCISVFAAGFHNVIASSGTAFTGAQAALLGRFSKQVVVNFDPDAAGAKATERTLGLLVEEEFDIRVLTLEQGFDPDLFVRRKGRDAYAAALKTSQRYFDYLIERARAQFSVRSGEGKVKAVNYLLPHIQRVPSRIVRRTRAGDCAETEHRFGGVASGTEACGGFAQDGEREVGARSAGDRCRENSDSRAELRDPGRRSDGLHFGFRRRISQRDCQFRHGIYRGAGCAARQVQQAGGGQLRSRRGWRKSYRTDAGFVDRGGIRHSRAHARTGIRSRPVRSPQRKRRVRGGAEEFATLFRLSDRAGASAVPGA